MKKKLLAILLSATLALSLLACAADEPAPPADDTTTDAPSDDTADEPADDDAQAASSFSDDFSYVEDDGTTFDIATYYNDLGVDCTYELTATGGVVNVPDDHVGSLPVPNEKYTIGFSVYYTVDEVGAMLLDSMKAYAEEAGVELKVNDANYDQNAQNQAIEQWILEEVDGVILAPCDFYAVKDALTSLADAGIPVVTLNPALAGSAASVVMSECKEQGVMAGQLLLDHLLAEGVEMKGTIVYQSLPFVHPNAATRSDGFKSVFADYPDVEIVELTGTSVEEHYAAFEGAITKYGDDMIGAFGLYSAATVGMIQAKLANGSDVPLTSIDNDKPILQAVYEGNCLGSACYSSTAPAYYCMGAIINLLNGDDVPSAFFYQNQTVTADNVEEMFEHYYAGKTLADYIAGAVE